jgi:hypothetical protein
VGFTPITMFNLHPELSAGNWQVPKPRQRFQ